MTTMAEQIERILDTYQQEGATGRDAIKAKVKLDFLRAEHILVRITQIDEVDAKAAKEQKKLIGMGE